MNKNKAISFLMDRGIHEIYTNNSFSSPTSKIRFFDAYWLVIDNIKFKYDLFVILNDTYFRKLHLFKIPARAISRPEKVFYQMPGRNSSSIKIEHLDNNFQDKQSTYGYSFLPYSISHFSYNDEDELS